MKLYNSKPPKLIRVNIKQAGQPVIHLAFDQCNLLDCAEALLSYINSDLPQKNSGDRYKITIQCREWENSKNGLSTSFSFIGPDSSFVRDCIVSHFDN
jgi:hypothetical protein